MNLETYLKTVENANQLAKRAGISTSIIYRALAGSDIKLSTALKLAEASGYKLDFSSIAVRDEPEPSP